MLPAHDDRCYKRLMGCPVSVRKLELLKMSSSVWQEHEFNFSNSLGYLSCLCLTTDFICLAVKLCKLISYFFVSQKGKGLWGESLREKRGHDFPLTDICMGFNSAHFSCSILHLVGASQAPSWAPAETEAPLGTNCPKLWFPKKDWQSCCGVSCSGGVLPPSLLLVGPCHLS